MLTLLIALALTCADASQHRTQPATEATPTGPAKTNPVVAGRIMDVAGALENLQKAPPEGASGQRAGAAGVADALTGEKPAESQAEAVEAGPPAAGAPALPPASVSQPSPPAAELPAPAAPVAPLGWTAYSGLALMAASFGVYAALPAVLATGWEPWTKAAVSVGAWGLSWGMFGAGVWLGGRAVYKRYLAPRLAPYLPRRRRG